MSRDENILTRLGRIFGQQKPEPERAINTEEWRKKVEGKEENEEKKGENEMMNMEEMKNVTNVVDPEMEQNRMSRENPENNKLESKYYISIRTGSIRTQKEFDYLVVMDCPREQSSAENERTLGLAELISVRFEFRIMKDGRLTSFTADLKDDRQFDGLLAYAQAGMNSEIYINPNNGSLVNRAEVDEIAKMMGVSVGDKDKKGSEFLDGLANLLDKLMAKVEKVVVIASTPLLGEREIPVKNADFMTRLIDFEKRRIDPEYFKKKTEVIDLNDPRD